MRKTLPTKTIQKLLIQSLIIEGLLYGMTKIPVEQVEEEKVPMLVVEQPHEQPITYEDRLKVLSSFDDLSIYQQTDNFILSTYVRNAIEDELEQLETKNHNVSFLVFDLNQAKLFAYEGNKSYYGASTIKGVYIPFLVQTHPEVFEREAYVLQSILVNSDNEAYAMLRNRYLQDSFDTYLKQMHVNPNVANNLYSDLTCFDLAKCWLGNDVFFKQDPYGKDVSKFYEDPYFSILHESFKDTYKTRSKAGWIDVQPDYVSTCDAGIVYDEEPYILVIMSDYPATLDRFATLVTLLDLVHKEMVYGPIQKNAK